MVFSCCTLKTQIHVESCCRIRRHTSKLFVVWRFSKCLTLLNMSCIQEPKIEKIQYDHFSAVLDSVKFDCFGPSRRQRFHWENDKSAQELSHNSAKRAQPWNEWINKLTNILFQNELNAFVNLLIAEFGSLRPNWAKRSVEIITVTTEWSR